MFTILSPHMDDAALSCFHLLVGDEDVRVVNVFAGVPRGEREPGWWDALTGATCPAERLAERVAEDRDALGALGLEPRYLAFVDAQYRRRAPAVGRVLAAIAGHSEGVVYAPAGLSGHPDHLLVRDAALALRAGGAEVRLYADLPHAAVFGWPGWVTGAAETRYLRTERMWTTWLAGAGLRLERMGAHTHALNGVLEAKHRVVAAYRTQATALEQIMTPDTLRYEVVWTLPEEPAH